MASFSDVVPLGLLDSFEREDALVCCSLGSPVPLQGALLEGFSIDHLEPLVHQQISKKDTYVHIIYIYIESDLHYATMQKSKITIDY